jgi:hypothetical protein
MKSEQLLIPAECPNLKKLLSHFDFDVCDIYAERPTLEIIYDRLQSFSKVLEDSKTDESLYRYYQGKYNGLAEMCYSLGTPGNKTHYTKRFIARINVDDWNHYEI